VVPLDVPHVGRLIGHDAEVAVLLDALRAGRSMGVCAVEGMGGIGKTALAATATNELADDVQSFPGGVAWISCEGLTGAAELDEVWRRVALSLGLDAVAGEADGERRRLLLARTLALRPQTLLALDNVETGLDAHHLITTLLIDGHTIVLLTARQRVDAPIDQHLAVSPLPDTTGADLVADRLHRVDGTRPDAADCSVLAPLAQALGGIPLGLELTAAYAGSQKLGLAQVLAEIQHDGVAALPLQRLRARFDRPWQVLTERQQVLFTSLSLLVGATFPREAAIALAHVCVPDNERQARQDVMDLVP
jgi:NB-ARC domain